VDKPIKIYLPVLPYLLRQARVAYRYLADLFLPGMGKAFGMGGLGIHGFLICLVQRYKGKQAFLLCVLVYLSTLFTL
jgi:hypothetical protein